MTFIQFKAYLASVNFSYKTNEKNHFSYILENKPRGEHIYWKHKNECLQKQGNKPYKWIHFFKKEAETVQCFSCLNIKGVFSPLMCQECLNFHLASIYQPFPLSFLAYSWLASNWQIYLPTFLLPWKFSLGIKCWSCSFLGTQPSQFPVDESLYLPL